jgi:3-oxoacyl-[acyl-carrier-protein] synthase-1
MKIYNIGDNIITSLGMTTSENVDAILDGKSGVRQYADVLGIKETIAASMIENERLFQLVDDCGIKGKKNFTRFELLIIVSIILATKSCQSVLADKRTIIILSTTKGNISLLNNSGEVPANLNLWHSAETVAEYFHNPNHPIVVSNACISGVAVQIVAKRMIEGGYYDTAIVVGADELSKFVISGFQSFKALSNECCKPFDIERKGLNIGEGAGTIVYQKSAEEHEGAIELNGGAISNDANHISGPSRTGEGLFLALGDVLKCCDRSELRFINVHGTATNYNDEMEAQAIKRAALMDLPVFSLKAYIGHTLGASGTIETIVSSHALKRGIIPQSLGFSTLGVSFPLKMVEEPIKCKNSGGFIKTVSGFGGCNAVININVRP